MRVPFSTKKKSLFNFILTKLRASPHPAAMYWGEELVAIYNEAYIGTLNLTTAVTVFNRQNRTGRPEAPHAHGPELQSCLGRDLG